MANFNADSWLSTVTVPDRLKRSWLAVQDRLRSASVPLISASISYTAFNLHVSINGGLTRICSWCGPRFTSTLLLNSHVGIALYLYHHKLFKSWPEHRKILYNCYMTVMFNFGSILLVAATKSYLPNSDLLRGAYSLVASLGLITVGLDLLMQVERKYINQK